MSTEYSYSKFYLSILEKMNNLVKKINIKSQLDNIYVHCGTNHLQKSQRNMDKLEEYILKLTSLRNKFPETKISYKLQIQIEIMLCQHVHVSTDIVSFLTLRTLGNT